MPKSKTTIYGQQRFKDRCPECDGTGFSMIKNKRWIQKHPFIKNYYGCRCCYGTGKIIRHHIISNSLL